MAIREMDEGAVFREANRAWGCAAMTGMAMEEMGELLTALNHFDRGRIDKDKVCEEIADVMIMMEQLALIFGQEKVSNWRTVKIDRLNERLLRFRKKESIWTST